MEKQKGASRFYLPFVSPNQDERSIDIQLYSVGDTRNEFLTAYGGNSAFRVAGAHALKISKSKSKKFTVPRLIQFDYFHCNSKQSLKFTSSKVRIEEIKWLDLKRPSKKHKFELKNYLEISDDADLADEFLKNKELAYEAFEKLPNLRGIVHLEKINGIPVWVTTMRLIKKNISNVVVANSNVIVKI